MFGMLDYRAHKLYRLVTWPFRIISWLILLGSTAIVALYIGVTLSYAWPVKLIIAYAASELAVTIIYFVLAGIGKILNYAFFWTIDVIPSKGQNEEEARLIVLGGPLVWLMLKMEREIENWTARDTDAFMAALNWRVRLVNSRDRVEQRITTVREFYDRTGKQVSALNPAEFTKMLVPLELPRWAKMFINPIAFYAVVKFIIVSFCIAWTT
jgi:hypothetical protein